MKSRRVLLRLLQLIAFCNLLTTVSLADEFGQHDKNQDGVLSGKELEGLKILDTDNDGELQRQEFMSAVKAQRQRAAAMVSSIFKERDGNEDGRLSGKECSGFEECDKNSDGRIIESELLRGLASGDAELKGKSFKEIRQIAESRFEKIDITEDGRLTGTEAYCSTHFDQNADSRITKEEFVIGLTLSIPDEEEDLEPGVLPTGGVEKILNEVVSAMNNLDNTKVVYQAMHEKLKDITDMVVLEYIFGHAAKSHSQFKLGGKDSIKQTKLPNGSVEASVELQCDKGDLTLTLTVLNNQIIGLALVSPEMNTIDEALFNDLMDEKIQRTFAAAYEPEIKQALKAIVAGEDELALQMIHPSVIQQIGEEAFKNLFNKLRSLVPKIDAVELETFSSDRSEKGLYTFTITYLVTSGSDFVRFGCTFQRAGLCSAMTGYSVEQVLDLAPPAPTPDDDVSPSKPSMKLVPNADWIETVSLRDGVKFQMPGDATRKATEEKLGPMTTYSYELPSKDMFFTVEITTLESDFTHQSDVFFESFRNALVNGNGSELLDEDISPVAKFPNQLLLIRNKNNTFTALRTIIAGKKIYRARWIGLSVDESTKVPARKFIESVTLIDEGGALITGPVEDLAVPPPAPVIDDEPAIPIPPPTPAPAVPSGN